MEMGLGRTGDRALGQPAVIPRWPLVLLPLVLAGCNAAPQIAGLLSGGAVGVATASPALGFATGVAVDAATNAGVRYYGRSRQNAEQNAIAAAAGDLAAGGHSVWHIDHTIPIGDEHGELEVTRTIQNPLADCKEIAFSVDSGGKEKPVRNWYIATICRQGSRWKWASAEPAVPRWGYLQ
jgi:hypothetical protein